MKSIVYRHRRLDTNEIFYIGISSGKFAYKRPYYKSNRNDYWKNVVNKTEYQVEIIADNLTKEDACELEEFLIQEYGRRDLQEGSLVNLTNGGEKNNGFSHTIESKDKISKSLKGRCLNSNVKEKIRISKKLQCNTKEYKKKVSDLKSKKVIQYSMDGAFIKKYKSLTLAALETNSRLASISRVCNSQRNSHNNYIWKFDES